jgi:hypothetical protein
MGLAPAPLARPVGLLALGALRSRLALTADDIVKADAFVRPEHSPRETAR